METSLLQPLEASLKTTTNSYCGRASHLFTKELKQSIMSVQQDVTQRRWFLSGSRDSDGTALLWRQWAGWQNRLRSTLNIRLWIAYQDWTWRKVICGTGYIFFILKWSQCWYMLYLSNERTIRSQMLSHHGGKCTDTFEKEPTITLYHCLLDLWGKTSRVLK